MIDCDYIALISQVASAVGECSSALIAAVALIAAFITLRRMQEQNRLASEMAGWGRIVCQISFTNSVPSGAASIFPSNVEQLKQREQLKQLYDVISRWRNITATQLPNHKYIILELMNDNQNNGTASPRNVRIKIKIRIPPRPGKNYVTKRTKFTIPLEIKIFKTNEVFYMPIENILACEVEANGEYMFGGQSYSIDTAKDKFDDYDLAFGIPATVGDENATTS